MTEAGMRASADRTGRSTLIVGGSLAGLFIGAILHRQGWRVRVFERVAESLENRGAGIATHEELFDAFDRAGVTVDSEIGIEILARVGFDKQGRETDRFPYRQILSSWGTLYRRLRAAMPADCYRLDAEVVAVDNRTDGASVRLRDGSVHHADLVVGADGIWSVVRAAVCPEAKPGYAGYVAWRGLMPETTVPQEFIQRHAGIQGFYVERNEQFTLYLVSGADDDLTPGRRRFGFLWYRAVDEQSELPDLLTEPDGKRNAMSISPNRIQPAHIARLREEAQRMLPPDFATVVQRTPHPFLQPICDLCSPRIASGSVALVGDAAFIARPHVGAGVLKAGADAVTLAVALERHATVADALAEYERERLPAGVAMVERSRYLGGYLEGNRRAHDPAPVLPMDEILRESGRGLGLPSTERFSK